MNGKRGMGVATPIMAFSLEEPRSELRGSSLASFVTGLWLIPTLVPITRIPKTPRAGTDPSCW
jgi:hypothetical protein